MCIFGMFSVVSDCCFMLLFSVTKEMSFLKEEIVDCLHLCSYEMVCRENTETKNVEKIRRRRK